MSQFIRQLFGTLFHRQQSPQIVRMQPSPPLTSPEKWREYWQTKSPGWVRTEPEIERKRQEELSQHRAITPNVEKGIYPFGGMKLSRADVEWLLATHENGRGPIIWSDESQRRRNGLDLRGADLRGEDLSRLPLARMRGGLRFDEWERATPEQRDWAGIHLENCNLFWTHLDQAKLRKAHLERTDLSWARLEGADLCEVHLEAANLFRAHLERTHLIGAHVEMANLGEVHLEKARLENITLSDEKHIGPFMVDAQLGDTNLAVVKWSHVEMLADEYQAREKKYHGKVKDQAVRLDQYERAVRANRQLAVALQDQGLNEDAARFAYRAQNSPEKGVLDATRGWTMALFSPASASRRIWLSPMADSCSLSVCCLAVYSSIFYHWNVSSSSFDLASSISRKYYRVSWARFL